MMNRRQFWRPAPVLAATLVLSTGSAWAQSDLCSIDYQAVENGVQSGVPDASGTLFLAFDDGSLDDLIHTDTLDRVTPPFAPPGGWFVGIANPEDAGMFWGRTDSRMSDPSPGTHQTFHLLLHPRFAETGIDSVNLGWSGGCFTAPNVTVLSMATCDSGEIIVPDMTAIDNVGFGRGTSPVWNDEDFCLAVGAKDDLVASVKLLLEGPFAGGGMNVSADYSNHLPIAQPYSDPLYDGTALDYDSLQIAAAIPDSMIDWVLVSLRSGVGPETDIPGSRYAAILLSNGAIVGSDGLPLRFSGISPGGYRIIVRHRNHLDVLSADTLSLSDGIGSWDFTTSQAQAHSAGGAPMKSLGSGMYGLFAADGNADGQATAPDFNLWIAATTAGETGYRPSDYNLDGQVTAPDFNLWIANTTAGAATQVPN